MMRERELVEAVHQKAEQMDPAHTGGSAQRGPGASSTLTGRKAEQRAQEQTGQQIWWWEGEVKKQVEERSTKTNLLAVSYKLTELATICCNLSSYWHNFLANIVSSRQVAIQLS